jgi:hypothetical protein
MMLFADDAAPIRRVERVGGDLHVRHHETRADRAEKWLYQISVEIEEKFFGPAPRNRPAATPRQISPEDYAPRRRSAR